MNLAPVIRLTPPGKRPHSALGCQDPTAYEPVDPAYQDTAPAAQRTCPSSHTNPAPGRLVGRPSTTTLRSCGYRLAHTILSGGVLPLQDVQNSLSRHTVPAAAPDHLTLPKNHNVVGYLYYFIKTMRHK